MDEIKTNSSTLWTKPIFDVMFSQNYRREDFLKLVLHFIEHNQVYSDLMIIEFCNEDVGYFKSQPMFFSSATRANRSIFPISEQEELLRIFNFRKSLLTD